MSYIINENIEEKANWRQILNKRAYKKNIVEHSETGKTMEFCLEMNHTMQSPMKRNLAMKAVKIQTRGNKGRITLKGRNLKQI